MTTDDRIEELRASGDLLRSELIRTKKQLAESEEKLRRLSDALNAEQPNKQLYRRVHGLREHLEN